MGVLRQVFRYAHKEFDIILRLLFIGFGGDTGFLHRVYRLVDGIYEDAHILEYLNYISFSLLWLFIRYGIYIAFRLLHIKAALLYELERRPHLFFTGQAKQGARVALREPLLFNEVAHIGGQTQQAQLV